MTADEFNKAMHEHAKQAMADAVFRPSHYKLPGGGEVIDIIRQALTREQLEGFYLGNILKYTLRHKAKGGTQDLKKATQYLEWLAKLADK